MSHKKDPYGAEHYGMWFVYAKGSGVFLQIGNTKIFNEHGDAYKYFGAKGNEDMCQKAAAAGYDTVQFIKHVDAVNYPCAAGIGASWMNMEIVAVKLVGTYSCGQAQGTAAALRAGWNGDKACKCDPNNPNTNCALTDAAEKLEMKALGAYAEHNSFNAKIAQAESDEDSAAAERYSLLKDKWLAKSGDFSSVYAAFCN